MAVYRLQCAFQQDSAFVRDAMVITPHFRTQSPLVPDSVDGLCEDLATALDGWTVGSQEIRVKGYDAEALPPVAPSGSAVRNAGGVGVSNDPRELAVCLSYYSGVNQPKHRGRLYIPHTLCGAGSAGLRPAATLRTKVGALATIFANLGGIDVDWVVWSRVDHEARPVTNWYVDDEWDIIRSRGMRPTTRTTGTLDE